MLISVNMVVTCRITTSVVYEQCPLAVRSSTATAVIAVRLPLLSHIFNL